MKVLSYFHDPHDPLFQSDVVGLWAMSFARMGFTPKICSAIDAQRHPAYSEFKELVRQVPTPNPAYYSESNFMRWLVAEIESPCLVTDWDVLNLRLRPRNFWPTDDLTILDRALVPCAVAGTKTAFQTFIGYLRRFKECLVKHNGRMIGGDMYVMQHFYKENTGECDSVVAADSHKLSLVHFPNAIASVRADWKSYTGNNRAKLMREFYAKHY